MSSLGQPGEPGQPGQAPQEGRGGAGGHGGHAQYRWAILAGIVMIVALAVGYLILRNYVDDNTTQIEALQAHDRAQSMAVSRALTLANQNQDRAIVNARLAEFRICVRQQVVRVAINIDRNADEPTLPIYDCTPNKYGGVARRLTPAETRAYERKVRKDGFTP